jgi:hypothetical protein
MQQTMRLALAILLAAAIFFCFGILAQAPDHHETDFYSFWAGARLLGPDLYNPEKAAAVQHAESPRVNGKSFIRPPFYALALWPFGRLPFTTAFVTWQLLNIAAVLLSIALWRCRPSSFVACAFFPPLWSCLRLGQDAPLLLLLGVMAAILIERKRELFGGAVLALFVAKPNLVPLIPFLLLVQKRHRALSGFFAGGIALYLISSLAMGFDWLIGYTKAVFGNEGTITPRVPGLAGLFNLAGAPKWCAYIGLFVGAAMIYRYARKSAWMHAFAFTVTIAVVFAPRSMVYDLVLLLPLLLLRFAPWVTPLAGTALVSIMFTPAPIIAELSAIAIAWRGRARSALAAPAVSAAGERRFKRKLLP